LTGSRQEDIVTGLTSKSENHEHPFISNVDPAG
jgi:hypothetical protein